MHTAVSKSIQSQNVLSPSPRLPSLRVSRITQASKQEYQDRRKERGQGIDSYLFLYPTEYTGYLLPKSLYHSLLLCPLIHSVLLPSVVCCSLRAYQSLPVLGTLRRISLMIVTSQSAASPTPIATKALVWSTSEGFHNTVN